MISGCKKYIIEGGNHYSNGFNFGLSYNRKSMTRQVRFNNSCRYEFIDLDQNDINKLFGFSYGHHHKNSVRFGWRYNKSIGMIELLAYVYKNGKLIMEWDDDIVLCKIERNKFYTLSIEVTESHYYFFVMDNEKILGEVSIKRPNKYLYLGYELFPYFGGNRTAPHYMSIDICK